MWDWHKVFELKSLVLLVGILVTVSIGGLIQIAPLFWLSSTIEEVKGMRPYSPLELAGRNIYVRMSRWPIPAIEHLLREKSGIIFVNINDLMEAGIQDLPGIYEPADDVHLKRMADRG